MPEPTTGTTQTPPVTTTTPPPAQTTPPGQGTAGATTTPPPSQTSTEQTGQTQTPPQTTPPPVTGQPQKLPPEEVQKRIDRMYARLQKEREQRLAAEAQLAIRPQVPPTTTDDEDAEPTTPPALTERDVEAIVERKERDKKFIGSEMRVFEHHPDALNEDGSFNMSSPFVQKYIDIGRRNPMLAIMENGPEMAEAMADKELGLDYRKGRVDEATRLNTQQTNNFTTSSTTAVPPTGTVELNEVEKKIARRMGMTDKQYVDNKVSNKVQQKSWEVKSR